VVAGVGFMVFNGETLSCIDTAPREGEPEGAWLGVKAEAARDVMASPAGGGRR
jgi:hypothetical protein